MEIMKKRVRGIIRFNDEIILVHRIREINKKKVEYYVVPGGGVEHNETLEEALKREIMEEIGIDIVINKLVYILKNDDEESYFYLCEYLSGVIGSGCGPEFNSKKYEEHGEYIIESVKIDEIINYNILKPIKEALLQDMNKQNIPFRYIMS